MLLRKLARCEEGKTAAALGADAGLLGGKMGERAVDTGATVAVVVGTLSCDTHVKGSSPAGASARKGVSQSPSPTALVCSPFNKQILYASNCGQVTSPSFSSQHGPF